MNIQNQPTIWKAGHKAALAILLAIQFAIAYAIGAGQLLANTELFIFPPIAVTVAIPVALFLAAYWLAPSFRRFVLAQSIRTLTMFQLWRVIGFSFLLLYAFDVLPALFAWPAGFGDAAVGVTAIYVVSRMDADPNYVFSTGFLTFHLLGLLDFVIALGTAALTSGVFSVLVADGFTSSALDVWPLNLFPSFIVPGFIILQLSALLKLRDMRRQAGLTNSEPVPVG